MTRAFILAFALIPFTAVAGVWDQMQAQSYSTLKGIVRGISMSGDSVSVRLAENEKSRSVETTLQLCEDSSALEEVRAMQSQQKIELLQQAYRSGETIELGFTGPWNPCLQTVSFAKPEPKIIKPKPKRSKSPPKKAA